MNIRRIGSTLAAVSVLSLAAGCSSTVDQDSLQDQVASLYTDQVGEEPDDVTCDDDIAAEEGATGECTVTAGEEELKVDVTVDSIDGDTASFTIEVRDPEAPAE